MTRFMIAAAFLAAVLAQPVHAQFGVPSVPGGGGGGLSAAEIDKFLAAAKVASEKMTKTEAALAPFVLSKEAQDKLQMDMTAAKAIQNPQEKEAKIAEVEKAAAAQATAALQDPARQAAIAKQLSGSTPKQKEDFKAVVENFLGAAVADIAVAKQGKSLATKKPELSAATKAPELVQASKELVDQAMAAVKVADAIQRLVTTAKIDIPAESFAKVLGASFS
jgi:hypothetical protein